MPSAETERRLSAAAVAVVFLILAGYGIAHHEMWRDELEIWLVARDSTSVADLAANMRTAGHPAVWYVLNFLLSRFTRNPAAMQIANVGIGVLTVWLLVRFAPFRSYERILLAFGYFQLYEFTIISRAYGLQLLLAYLFCILYSKRASPGGQVLVLVLLAHTSLYGTLIAGLCGLLLAWDRWGRAARVGWVGVGTVLLGSFLAFLHVLIQSLRVGEAHAGSQRPSTYDLRWLVDAISTVGRGFVPIPDPTSIHFWNTHVLDLLPGWGLAAGAVLGLVSLILAAILLRARRAVLGLFGLGLAAMLCITLFVWHGYARHHGQVFLFFVVCAWLSCGERREAVLVPATRAAALARHGLAGILILQTAAAAMAYDRDLRQPFSHAKHVAAYLRDLDIDDAVVVGSFDYAAQPITAYLDQPIYYPEDERFGTFVHWGKHRRMLSPLEVMDAAVRLADTRAQPVVLVLCYPLAQQRPGDVLAWGGHRLVYLTAFVGAVVPDENYHLYLLPAADGRASSVVH